MTEDKDSSNHDNFLPPLPLYVKQKHRRDIYSLQQQQLLLHKRAKQ